MMHLPFCVIDVVLGSIFEGLQVRQRNRQKRATGSNKVELLIFCDYGIYD